jgi:predicted dehydrogenase
MNQSKKIKWGIIGCGNIANKFAGDLALINDATLIAVASRNIDKAKRFAERHNSQKAYGTYNELFSDTNVDIVYIATPHTSHAELSIKAMEHGKHVLCEKPLALNRNEARAMIKTSKHTGKFFMEALWTRFNPSLVAIKKRIDKGEIGRIEYIHADFSFILTSNTNSRVLALSLGGGALLDIGIYTAFIAYLFLGVPEEINAKSIFHKQTKCDIETSMSFKYENAKAELYSSFTSDSSKKQALIRGANGDIFINSRWHVPSSYTLVKNNKKTTYKLPTLGIGFTHEILECHSCITADKIESENWSHQNSLDLITILDTVRKQVGLKYPQE